MDTVTAAVDRYWDCLNNWNEDSLRKPIYFLVNAYLVSSFLYYHLDTHLMSDHDYDVLCAVLKDRWTEIYDNPYVWGKTLLDYDALSAGSGFSIARDKYPNIIAEVASALAVRKNNGEKQGLIEVLKNA
jgi:hypothetical protein